MDLGLIMKCLICSEKSDDRLLCSKHIGVDLPLRYLSAHTCHSFKQKEGKMKGFCDHYLLCAPIKKALQNEFIFNNLGHLICPYASLNLSQAIYGKFTKEEIQNNYPECIE